MASKMSIISLFIVLLATFCYSVPVEEITTLKPDHSVLTDVTTATQETKVNMFLLSEAEAGSIPNLRDKRSTEDSENEKSSTQGQSEDVTRSSNPSEEDEDDDFTTPKFESGRLNTSTSRENETISSNSSTLNKTEDKQTLNGSPFIVHDNNIEFVRRILSESSTSPNPPDNFNESEWGGSPVTKPTSSKGKQPQTTTSETEYSKRAVEDITTPEATTSESEYPRRAMEDITTPEATTSETEYPRRAMEDITTPETTTSETEYPRRALEDITTPETLLTTSSSNNTQQLTYSEIIVPGDVQFTTLNGTGSREHILNQLSRGEKHSIVH